MSDDWSSDEGEDTNQEPALPSLPRKEVKHAQPSQPEQKGNMVPKPSVPPTTTTQASAARGANKTLAASTIVFVSNNGQRFHAGLALLHSEEKRTWTVYLYAQAGQQRKVLWTANAGPNMPVTFGCTLQPAPSTAMQITHNGQQIGVGQCRSRSEAFRWSFVISCIKALQQVQNPKLPTDARPVLTEQMYDKGDSSKRKKVKTKHQVRIGYQAWLVSSEGFDQDTPINLKEGESDMSKLECVPVEERSGADPQSISEVLKGLKVNDQRLLLMAPGSKIARSLLQYAGTEPAKHTMAHRSLVIGNVQGLLGGDHPVAKESCLLALLFRPIKTSKKSGKSKGAPVSKVEGKTVPKIQQSVPPKTEFRLPAANLPKVDIGALMNSLKAVNANVKTLPNAQMAIVQKMLSDILSAYKSTLKTKMQEEKLKAEQTATSNGNEVGGPGGPGIEKKTGEERVEAALKTALGALKSTLRSSLKVYMEANTQESDGTLLGVKNSFKKFLSEFEMVKKKSILDTDQRASLEMQISQARQQIAAMMDEKKNSSNRDAEMQQIQQDYTETLKASMESEKKLADVENKLAETTEMRDVFEKALKSYKTALEDESKKRRRMEAQIRILEVVAKIGVPRMWGSDIKRVLAECDVKAGKNPTAQLQDLINNPPLDDDDDDDD